MSEPGNSDPIGAATYELDKEQIRKFYDVVSSHFHDLWGEHIHHGYWVRGDETKETAQLQLIERLAQAADIQPGQKLLDVGCGTGASSVYLAKNHHVEATGITISPVQVELATMAASREDVKAKFLLMDAEAMQFDELFDVVWSIESISHYRDIAGFFASVAKLLPSNGTVALIDWFKKPDQNPAHYKRDFLPIERGMLLRLRTMGEYESWMKASGLEVMSSEVLNRNCAKTWDVGLGIIKKKSVWKLAATNGEMFLDFLRAFRATRAGFASGKLVYGLLVARKI